jgi:hypothetical protein
MITSVSTGGNNQIPRHEALVGFPVRGGRPGPTLVLNSISHRRQQNLNEYGLLSPTKDDTQARLRRARTFDRILLGAQKNDGEITHISVYRTSCKVHRITTHPNQKKSPGAKRGRINSFSSKSRAHLKHVASNCFPLLISQFCLTYGTDNAPIDGLETHRHLSLFLNCVRRKYAGATYLWVLEFQTKRGVPHFHVFFSFPPSPEKQAYLSSTWCRITKGTEKQERVHQHHKNFTSWDMKKGGYLCKYLEKESQKHVPAGFSSVGRFWGCSRNMVPHPDQWIFPEIQAVTVSQIDKVTGESHEFILTKVLYRSLRNHHEKTMRNLGIKRKSRITKKYLSTVNLPSGGLVARQVLEWFRKEIEKTVPF